MNTAECSELNYTAFLSAFVELRNATIALECQSVRTEIGSQWKDFHEILYLGISEKYVQKTQV
jgi:hypothetical protein